MQLMSRAPSQPRIACQSGATALELWTDTRFTRAHRFYAKHGYNPTGERRALHDLGATLEDRFVTATEADT